MMDELMAQTLDVLTDSITRLEPEASAAGAARSARAALHRDCASESMTTGVVLFGYVLAHMDLFVEVLGSA